MMKHDHDALRSGGSALNCKTENNATNARELRGCPDLPRGKKQQCSHISSLNQATLHQSLCGFETSEVHED